jgi:hypothetical protein
LDMQKNRYEADKCQLGEVYDIVNKKEDGARGLVSEYKGLPKMHFRSDTRGFRANKKLRFFYSKTCFYLKKT